MAIMLLRCPDMVFDEAPGQSYAHHPYSQEEKPGFPCERVVVEFDRLNGSDLEKLFISSELISARRKCAEVTKIR